MKIAPMASTVWAQSGTVIGVTPWINPDSTTCDSTCAVRWKAKNIPSTASVDTLTGLFTWIAGLPGDDWPNVKLLVSAGNKLKDSLTFALRVLPPDSVHFGLLHAKQDFSTHSRIDSMRAEWTNFTTYPLRSDFSQDSLDVLVLGAQKAGLELVLNVSTDQDYDQIAHWPPESTADSAGWMTKIAFLAARYNLDSPRSVRLDSLSRSVKWWHVEEESGFFRGDECGCDYMRELMSTRRAVLAGNPSAKILLIGLQSDYSWLAAYIDTATSVLPVREDNNLPMLADTSLVGYKTFVNRTRNWLVTGGPWADTCNVRYDAVSNAAQTSYWYDAVDMHSFERKDAIRGKVHWVNKLQPFHTAMPLWVNEAGGPAYLHRIENSQVVYTDTLNAESVYKMYGEALANGVKRYAWQTFPGGDISDTYRNVALFSDPNNNAVFGPDFRAKPSFQAYRALTGLIKNYSAASDDRIPDALPYRIIVPDPTNHPDSTIHVYIPLDERDQTACTFNERFEAADSAGWIQSNIVWRGAGSSVDSVFLETASFDTTAVFTITRRPLLGYQGPSVSTLQARLSTIVVVDTVFNGHTSTAVRETLVVSRVGIHVSSEPLIVSCRQPFSVYQARFSTSGAESLTAVSESSGGPRNRITVRSQRSGAVMLEWSLAQESRDAAVDIVDVAGRVVRSIAVDVHRDTHGVITLDTRAGSQRIPFGIYFAALRSGGRPAAYVRFAVLR